MIGLRNRNYQVREIFGRNHYLTPRVLILIMVWVFVVNTLAVHSESMSAILPRVFIGNEGSQLPGQPLTLHVRDHGFQSVSAELLGRTGNRVSQSAGYRVPINDLRNEFPGLQSGDWILFLPLPNTMDPGLYRLKLRMNTVDGVNERGRIVRVSHRSFLSEEISLSTGLTQVRTSNPEVRVQQAKQLIDVLERPDTKAWFHTGQLTYPLETIRRTSFYGDRRIYRYDDGTTSRSIHIGVDYGGSPGTRIYAPGSGRVVFDGFRQVTGNTLVIEHLPGVFSLFFHLEKLLVTTGDIVEQGVTIGTLGATGLATGPHLHWELRFGTEAIDPEYFLSKPLLDSYIIF